MILCESYTHQDLSRTCNLDIPTCYVYQASDPDVLRDLRLPAYKDDRHSHSYLINTQACGGGVRASIYLQGNSKSLQNVCELSQIGRVIDDQARPSCGRTL